jgi:hypothetical protein
MHHFFLGHYGLDWAAAVFMFLSMYRLGKHHRDGFILAAIASGFWIAFNIRVDSAGGIVANAVILAMTLRSFSTFQKASGTRDQASGQTSSNPPASSSPPIPDP